MKYTQFICGLIIGALAVTTYINTTGENLTEEQIQNELIAQYYASEVATLVSPHSIRERMTHGKDEFVLVDVRAVEDYEREHIAGAINISGELSPEELTAKFRELPSDKEIIIYCYSSACMNGRKVGHHLAQEGIFVKEMTIGWNEWRYAWESWNYETEWDEHTVEDYVVSGSEPGAVPESAQELDICPIDGEFAC
jgi:rhodanese-related sulfurtransferase